jgi:hypothetical protein
MTREIQKVKPSEGVLESSKTCGKSVLTVKQSTGFKRLLVAMTRKVQNIISSDNAMGLSTNLEETIPSPTTSQPIGFMRLPLELREQVYGHLLSDLPTTTTLRHKDENLPLTYLPRGHLPSLAYTNHSILQELCLTYLRSTTLQLDDEPWAKPPGFLRFLRSFPHDAAFKSIRALDYNRILLYFTLSDLSITESHHSLDDDIYTPSSVVMRCSGLKSLVLRISAYDLIHFHPGYFSSRDWDRRKKYVSLKTPQELDARLNLSAIFEHTGNFKLRLVVDHVAYLAEDMGLTCQEFLDGYVNALESHRVQKGSRVKLQVVHKCDMCGAQKGKYMWVD